MTDNSNVTVKITSTNEYGTIKESHAGMIANKSGKWFIRYKEDEKTSTTIKTNGDTVEILRSINNVGSKMIYDRNNDYSGEYQTEYGAMNMKLHTYDVKITEEEKTLSIKLRYDVFLNDAFASNNKVTIEIKV